MSMSTSGPLWNLCGLTCMMPIWEKVLMTRVGGSSLHVTEFKCIQLLNTLNCNLLELLRGKKHVIKVQLLIKMLVITKGLHLNIFFFSKEL